MEFDTSFLRKQKIATNRVYGELRILSISKALRLIEKKKGNSCMVGVFLPIHNTYKFLDVKKIISTSRSFRLTLTFSTKTYNKLLLHTNALFRPRSKTMNTDFF